MKPARMGIVLATLTVVLCFGPEIGWSTRVFTSVVTGTVTSTPTRTQIEVDHQVYHFKANSVADKQARTVNLGQIVDLTLDPTADTSSTTVMSIAAHGVP